jgi:hypothetical protein
MNATLHIPNPAIGHKPQPAGSTSNPQNLLLKAPLLYYPLIYSVFQVATFQDISLSKLVSLLTVTCAGSPSKLF